MNIVRDLSCDPVGKWKKVMTEGKWDRWRYYCPACGDWQTYGEPRFCPNCGVRVEKDGEQNE